MDRRVVHYFYFYVLWMIIHIVVTVAIFAGSPVEAIWQIALAFAQPYGVLWFIYLLAIFGLVTKAIFELKVPNWIVLVLATLMQVSELHTPSYTLTQFAGYYVYFYIGFVGAPLIFQGMNWASENRKIALVALGLWAITNFVAVYLSSNSISPDEIQMGYARLPGFHFMLAIFGSLAICTTVVLLSPLRSMSWLAWTGRNYVAFALPMSFVSLLGLKTGLLTDSNLLSVTVFSRRL